MISYTEIRRNTQRISDGTIIYNEASVTAPASKYIRRWQRLRRRRGRHRPAETLTQRSTIYYLVSGSSLITS